VWFSACGGRRVNVKYKCDGPNDDGDVECVNEKGRIWSIKSALRYSCRIENPRNSRWLSPFFPLFSTIFNSYTILCKSESNHLSVEDSYL